MHNEPTKTIDEGETTPRAKRFTSIFRFKLRTLLFVFVVVSAFIGWYAHLSLTQRWAVDQIAEHGGGYIYDFERDWQATLNDGSNTSHFWHDPPPPGPKWLVNAFGVDFFASVVSVEIVDPKDVALIKNFRKLERLKLRFKGSCDLSLLATHREIVELRISLVTVDSLEFTKEMNNLKYLYLYGTDISSLKGIGELDLEYLSIGRTGITDLTPLFSLKGLKLAEIMNTPVSQNEISKLKEKFPNIQ